MTTVELTENSELIFNNQPSEITDFEVLASTAMNELEKQGIPGEEVTFSLKVAQNVKMGLVSDIQMQLRELNARKVNYSN